MTNEALEAVKSRLAAGDSPETIAIQLKLDIGEVEDIANENEQERRLKQSNADILKDNLRVLQELLPMAEWTYKAVPDVDNVTALTSLVQTSIQTIKEIEARKDPAVIMNEILAKVLQPIFRDFVKHATIETNRSRGVLEQALPKEHHAAVDTALKDIIKGLGRVLSSDYKGSVEILSGILGCKSEDEKVKPMLRVVTDTEGDEDESPEASAEHS